MPGNHVKVPLQVLWLRILYVEFMCIVYETGEGVFSRQREYSGTTIIAGAIATI